MNIGFFVQGVGEHRDIAQHLVSSTKRVMPGVEVWQLTDGDTPKVKGIDGCVRLAVRMPMAVRRMRLHAMLDGDWLFVDTDVVVQKDVRGVFESPFLVAVTDRVGSIWEHSPDVKDMPYNMGVTFSRSPEFWKDVTQRLLKEPAHLQQWCGDQLVVCRLVKEKHEQWGPGAAKVLPGHVYNFTPDKSGVDASHAALLHFKGPRKHLISEYLREAVCRPS